MKITKINFVNHHNFAEQKESIRSEGSNILISEPYQNQIVSQVSKKIRNKKVEEYQCKVNFKFIKFLIKYLIENNHK